MKRKLYVVETKTFDRCNANFMS